jgi:hypothetical protein
MTIHFDFLLSGNQKSGVTLVTTPLKMNEIMKLRGDA